MERRTGAITGPMAARATVVLLALLVCGLGAGTARAVVVKLPDGRLIGIAPRGGATATAPPGVSSPAAQPAVDSGDVDYNGGPVVHSSAPYLIFWTGSSDSIPISTQTLLTRYFTDVAHDSGLATNDYSVVRQYSDMTGIAGYAQTFSPAQAIPDAHAYPAQDLTNCPNSDVNATYYPMCITDAQLQSELTRLISADDLPTDGATTASELDQDAPIYFIVTPANVNICVTSTDCAATAAPKGFCSYHGHYDDGTNNVLYASIPLLGADSTDPSLSPKQCQDDGNSVVQEPNSGVDPDGGDVAIKYTTHEDLETITDPLLNAWYDKDGPSGPENEVADNCNQYADPSEPTAGTSIDAFQPVIGGSATAGTLYDQIDNGDDYYVQSVWSNGDTSCELQPPADAPPLSPTFTEPAGTQAVGSPVDFDGSAGSSPVSSTTWSFGDGATSYASSATTGDPAPGTIQHTYTNPGVYTVTLTVVDTHGNLATVTHTVTVGSRPNAQFSAPTATPLSGSAVTFDGSASSDSNSGGSVSSYSWSFGDGTTGTGATPTHTYTSPGIYTVTLTVTDNFGLASSAASLRLEVIGPPSAAFSFSPASPVFGHAVTFAGGASSDPNSGGGINNYGWSFGDGGTGAGAAPSHTYRTKGSYTVKLTVTDNFGLSATVSHVVTVAAFGPPTESRGSLTGITKSRPKLTFQLAAGTNAPRLDQVVIGLPAGLSFAKKGLAAGLSVKGAGGRKVSFTESLSGGVLTIKLKSAAGVVQVTVGGAAIAARKTLETTVARGKVKSLDVPVTAIDSSRTRTRLMLKLRV